MDEAYATSPLQDLVAPWLHCRFQEPWGFDLIKGFVSWGTGGDQGVGVKEREEGRYGKTKWRGEERDERGG